MKEVSGLQPRVLSVIHSLCLKTQQIEGCTKTCVHHSGSKKNDHSIVCLFQLPEEASTLPDHSLSADAGLSHTMSMGDGRHTGRVGTLLYVSPEIKMCHGKTAYTQKVDIYRYSKLYYNFFVLVHLMRCTFSLLSDNREPAHSFVAVSSARSQTTEN